MTTCENIRLVLFAVLAITVFEYSESSEKTTLKNYRQCIETVHQAEEFTKVPAECLQAGKAGVPGAQYLVGDILLSLDAEKNAEQAAEWFSKAAATGHPPAMFNLSLMHFHGVGVKQDQGLAWSNLRAAVCSGLPSAVRFAADSKPDIQCPQDGKVNALDGVWEGHVSIISSPDSEDLPSLEFGCRLSFDGDEVRVYMRSAQDLWQKVKPGTFSVAGIGPNAVLHSVSDGWDYDGRWIETWAFSLTKKSQKEMAVVWVRQVNNLHLPPSDIAAVFTAVGEGLFARSVAVQLHPSQSSRPNVPE